MALDLQAGTKPSSLESCQTQRRSRLVFGLTQCRPTARGRSGEEVIANLFRQARVFGTAQ